MLNARQLLIDKKYEESIEAYSKIVDTLQTEERAIAYTNMALCQINLKEYNKALILADKAIQTNPQYVKAQYRKAQILMLLQQYEEALSLVNNLMQYQRCQEVIELKEKIIDAYYDPNLWIQELDSCVSEKDYQKYFNSLYPRLENYPNINKFLVLLLSKKIQPYQTLKLVHNFKIKCDQIRDLLIQDSKIYIKNEKEAKIHFLYVKILSIQTLNEELFQLIMDNMDYFFNKNLETIVTLFIQNSQFKAKKQQIEQIARFLAKQEDKDVHSIQFMWITQIMMSVINDEIFDFFKKDYFKSEELIILIAGICQFSQLYPIEDKILNTVLKKLKKPYTIDLIIQLLMVALKNEQFSNKITTSQLNENVIETLFQILQEQKSDFPYKIKILTIFVQLLSQQKYIKAYDQVFQLKINFILPDLLESSLHIESLIILSFLTKFDEAKKILIVNKEFLKDFIKQCTQITQKKKQYQFQTLKFYQIDIMIIQILYSLSIDRFSLFKSEQKERFGLDDETMNMALEIQKKYTQDNQLDYLTYDQKFMIEYKVIQFLAIDLRVTKIIGQFLDNYKSFISEQNTIIINGLLAAISQKDLSQYLFDKETLRYAADQVFNKQYKVIPYLAVTLHNVNPQLIEFQDAQLLCKALIKCTENSKHELHQFWSLLGIVQFTSLGDYVRKDLINIDSIIQLQNLIIEDNLYVVHAALQVLNNLSITQQFQELIKNKELDHFIQLLCILIDANIENLDKKSVSQSDFSHPIQIQLTIISVLGILSQVDYFKTTMLQQDFILSPNFYVPLVQYLKLIQSPDIHIKKLLMFMGAYGLKIKFIQEDLRHRIRMF
ncbi:hypothetical protein pb186bvf_015201 [Paramecium bursaria]